MQQLTVGGASGRTGRDVSMDLRNVREPVSVHQRSTAAIPAKVFNSLIARHALDKLFLSSQFPAAFFWRESRLADD